MDKLKEKPDCISCYGKGYYVTAKEYGNQKIACSTCNNLNKRKLSGVKKTVWD